MGANNMMNRLWHKAKRPSLLTLLFLVFVFFLWLNRGLTLQGDVLAMSVWQDKGAQQSFEQLIQNEQDPNSLSVFQRELNGGFSGGYSRDAYWFKFTPPAQPQNQQLYLEVLPTYLDSVTLYWPDEQGQYQEMTLGDQLAFTQRFIKTRGFVFPVEQGTEPRTGYIRLQTTSSSIMLLTAWHPEDFIQSKQQEYFIFALLIGIGLSLILFNAIQTFAQRTLVYHVFIFFLIIQVAGIFIINGFASQFIFSQQPALDSALVGIMTLLLLVSISLGHYFFLRLSWQETPVLFSLTWGGIVLAVLGMAAVLFDWYVEIMPSLGLYVMVLYVSWIVFGLKRVRQKDPYAHWVLFASVAGILSSVVMIMVLLGWFSVENIGLYTYQVGAIAAIFAFQVIISGYVKDSLTKNKQLTIERVINQKLLQQEQLIQRQQSQFIAMLTHEIKTPLSVIQIALSQFSHQLKPHALTASQDIVAILDRCAISERLEASAMEAKLEPIKLVSWMQAFLAYMDFDAKRLNVDMVCDGLYQVEADPLYLRIIFSNLIENAFKYSPADSTIQLQFIELKDEQDRQQLAVRVTNLVGKVDFPEAEHVFDKFYRAKGAHRVSGSGIGLYLVHELVRAMQADIVYSHTETSVSFTVYFHILNSGKEKGHEVIVG